MQLALTVCARRLPWTLPLTTLPAAGGTSLGDGEDERSDSASDGGPLLDRCFCRYVTQPTLDQKGAALLAASARHLLHPPAAEASAAAEPIAAPSPHFTSPSASSASSSPSSASPAASVAVHLRTGFADMRDDETMRAGRASQIVARALTAKWFEAACDNSTLGALSRALVLSDSPGLVAHVRALFPHVFGTDEIGEAEGGSVAAGGASGSIRGKGVVAQAGSNWSTKTSATTRSWSNGFDAKRAAAVDAIAAGYASEVRVSRYSVMLKPAVARSVCTRKVATFGRDPSSGCPRLDATFWRNLQILTGSAKTYECALQQAPPDHPCAGLRASHCRKSFLVAMK